jgi:hypothetical protein
MSEFREELDELIETAKDNGYDHALGQCGTGTTVLMVERKRAKTVALYDARTKLAQDLLDYILEEPIGYAWVVGENGIAPAKNLVELTQLLNRCEEAGLVVKA